MVTGEKVYRILVQPLYMRSFEDGRIELGFSPEDVSDLRLVLFDLTEMDAQIVEHGNGKAEFNGPGY